MLRIKRSLKLFQACIDEDSLVHLLGVQPHSLFDEDEGCAHRKDGDEESEPYKKSEDAIAQDEANDSTACGSGCPIDVATLHAHELQRTLESFEHGVTDIIST